MPVGTGFFVGYVYKTGVFPFLVTADHVLDLVQGECIWIRVNKNGGGCQTVSINKNTKIVSANNDVSMLPLSIDFNLFDAKAILLQREYYDAGKITVWEQEVGDEVATVGLYSTHYGEEKNLPVLRIGHIAMMPGEPVLSHRGYVNAYLIEMRSIAGISGSPVSVNLPPVRIVNGQLEHLNQIISVPIGICVGYHLMQSTEDRIIVPQIQGEELLEQKPPAVDERLTGFAVVIPWERLFDIIETDWVRGQMDVALAKAIMLAGARPSGIAPSTSIRVPRGPVDGKDSASPSRPDENPTHKEDFTSLLNAAAKTKPQGD